MAAIKGRTLKLRDATDSISLPTPQENFDGISVFATVASNARRVQTAQNHRELRR